MQRIKVKNLPLLVSREMEEKIRMKLIAKLASRQEIVVPVVEYSYDDEHNQQKEITSENIVVRGVIFQTGYLNTRVQLLIRPDTPVKIVIEALNKLAEKVRIHDGNDWMDEFAKAMDREIAEAAMQNDFDEIPLAEISKTGGAK